MKFKGIGTEQLEKAIHSVLPEIRTLRIDADTTKHKGSHQKLFRSFATGKADVLIGTQMIAKGLHFPQVTLVGVINADSNLNIPDFRASESVFQLITQVAGRAGRGAIPGEVIIQTRLTDNQTIKLASKNDYENFFKEEMAVRSLFKYPPAFQMVKLLFIGSKSDNTITFAQQVYSFFVEHLPKSFELTPPIPAGYAKVKDKYRFHFFIRGTNLTFFAKVFEDCKVKIPLPSSIKMRVDIHPLSTYF